MFSGQMSLGYVFPDEKNLRTRNANKGKDYANLCVKGDGRREFQLGLRTAALEQAGITGDRVRVGIAPVIDENGNESISFFVAEDPNGYKLSKRAGNSSFFTVSLASVGVTKMITDYLGDFNHLWFKTYVQPNGKTLVLYSTSERD